MNWLKGAKWRKWDLHVHTPASHNFSGDWNQFIIQLGNADCDVIGINDYFSVAGYKEIQRRLSDPGAPSEGNKPYREALEKLKGIAPESTIMIKLYLVGPAVWKGETGES